MANAMDRLNFAIDDTDADSDSRGWWNRLEKSNWNRSTVVSPPPPPPKGDAGDLICSTHRGNCTTKAPETAKSSRSLEYGLIRRD